MVRIIGHILLGVFLFLLLAAVGGFFFSAGCFTCRAKAHDSWISRGGHRNAAGEWCCGEGDCFALPPSSVGFYSDGYHLLAADGTTLEVVPQSEAQPSPDGAYWRCKRPDGSRRCFFAPPPGS